MKPAVAQASRLAVLLGSGGHAKVVLALARACGLEVVGVCDPALAATEATEWRGLPVLGSDDALEGVDPRQVSLLNGIGQTTGGSARQRIYEQTTGRGFRMPALVHPAAIVDPTVVLSDGVQVMAGVVLQPDVHVGENSIINTRASVDHDGRIGRHVHIAPGATLCGNVNVGDGAFIGAGATVVQQRRIGSGSFLCAGSLLSADLEEGKRWPIKRRPHDSVEQAHETSPETFRLKA